MMMERNFDNLLSVECIKLYTELGCADAEDENLTILAASCEHGII